MDNSIEKRKLFNFYNLDQYKRIYVQLDEKRPIVIITTTKVLELLDCAGLAKVTGAIKEYILESN